MADGTWVGLDVHARKVVAGVLDAGSGELRSLRAPTLPAETIEWLARFPAPVRVAYAAGPTGYGLARACAAAGPRGARRNGASPRLSRPASCVRTMLSMPLANPSTLDRPAAAARPARDVLRGGALEPEPHAPARKAQAKAYAYCQRPFLAQSAEGLSLSGGASIRAMSSSS
jgi:hypothetical protein